ncbi:hypothetical protein DMUE_2210 [Dictyocoela muelleri]|nr:hypothetical protein DMUE_2210 [Dictyocoela muelleri]
MKNKSKMTYLNVFEFIKNEINREAPHMITIDFEMAAFLALKEVFTESKIQGCFFHFSQLLFRSVQRFNLYKAYLNNVNIRTTFRMMLALAFVPPKQIYKEFLKLDSFINNDEELKLFLPLWKYFKNTYGKSLIYKNNIESSIFCVDFWSVYDRVINDFKKTNNALEGWNRSLNRNISQKNPSLYEIGIELEMQHAIVENRLNKLLLFPISRDNTPSEQNNDLIKSIVCKFDEFYELDFLKAVGMILKLKEI